MANWHFSCRKNYQEWWIKQTGDLKTDEIEVLKSASELFKKYSFGQNYWGNILLLEPDETVWIKAGKYFNKKDYLEFKRIEKAFLPRFMKIWNKERLLLKNWKEKLTQTQGKVNFDGLFKDLDLVFGLVEKTKTIDVILLLSIPGLIGGGGNLKDGNITLEISGYDITQIRPAWLILCHELIHSNWQTKEWHKKIKSNIEKTKQSFSIEGIPTHTLINESITESLFPHGCLSEKYFNFPTEDYFQKTVIDVTKSRWRDFMAYKLKNEAKKYLEEGRLIDDKFILLSIELLNKYYCDNNK